MCALSGGIITQNNRGDKRKRKIFDKIRKILYDKEKIKCRVKEINWYESIEKLLMLEGTKYTLSSTDDYDEGIKSINSINGYKDAIKSNGVYAIHIEYLK